MSRTGERPKRMERVAWEENGVVHKAHRSWYRGEHCNYYPRPDSPRGSGGLKKFVLQGLLPEEPFIHRGEWVLTLGSCFAENVATWLAGEGFTVAKTMGEEIAPMVRAGEGIVNTAAILEQFEWALETGEPQSGARWHNWDGSVMENTEAARAATRRLILNSRVFIITLGLSEVWYNKETKEVYWRAIPKEEFDEARHGFRVLSAEENEFNLSVIYKLIKHAVPGARVIFTLSPIPLVATFRDMGCLVANEASKANLRAAIDGLMRRESLADAWGESLFYWPSYELVREWIEEPYGEDGRHIHEEALSEIMEPFRRYYCVEQLELSRCQKQWLGKHCVSDMPHIVIGGCGRSGTSLLRHILDEHSYLAAGPETGLFLPVSPQAAMLIGEELGGDLGAKLAWWLDLKLETVQEAWKQSCCQVNWVGRLGRAYVLARGARLWVEKTPRNVRHLKWILDRWPRARFINVIRDGRDVVCSLRTHPKYRWNAEKGELERTGVKVPWKKCIERWASDVQQGMQYKGHPRVKDIRYERLVDDTYAVLEDLCRWLGIPFESSMLEWHKNAAALDGSRSVAKDPQGSGSGAMAQIYNGSVGRWKRDMPKDVQALFKKMTGGLLAGLGYGDEEEWNA